jgi:hypothetical protein
MLGAATAAASERMAGNSTIEAVNAFLPAFMEDFNRRFGKLPFNYNNLCRSLAA